MAYKKPGSMDFSRGRMGWFIIYCPHCNDKVVLLPEEVREIKWLQKRKSSIARDQTKKLLTSIADRL